MQSLGFAFAMQPALKRLYPDRDECASRLALHEEYFNTQPYLASFILGAAVKLEQDRALGRGSRTDVSGLKATLAPPLGALGDSFFWGALKPLAASSGVALLLTGLWWAPLMFLAFYNIWHVGLRTWLLFLGYRTGGDAVSLMAKYGLPKTAMLFKAMSLSVTGAIVGMMALWMPELNPGWMLPGPLAAAAGCALMLIFSALLRRGVSPIQLMLGLAAVCLALAYMGVIA